MNRTRMAALMAAILAADPEAPVPEHLKPRPPMTRTGKREKERRARQIAASTLRPTKKETP